MDKHQMLRVAAMALVAGLAGCGGGGGNPGQCFGSPEVCLEGGNPNFDPSAAPASDNVGAVAPGTDGTSSPGGSAQPAGTPGNPPGSTANGSF
jgi:hypothetical protein